MLKMQTVALTAATATTSTASRPAIPFVIPARFRSLGLKALIAAALTSVVLAVCYFGFAINVCTRVATAAEHVANTAQHSLQANFEAPYINHYNFKALFPAQQRVYADVYRAAYLTRDMVTVNDMSEAEIASLVRTVWNDSPELFYLDPEVTIETSTIRTAAEHSVSTVYLSYSLDKQDVPAARDNFERTLSETAAIAANCQSDANKVSMLQTWMRANVVEAGGVVEAEAEPVEEPAVEAATAYDVLINGEAGQQGNAQLFNALCGEVGVDSRTVASDDEDVEATSATNAVMLGNDWRYVDIASEGNSIAA